MVDIEELKRLAEKATPGPWWVDSHGMNMSSVADGENFAAQIFAPKPYHEKAIRHDETGNLSHWRNDWDASFIAAANPAAVLELIAEVERFRAEALHITAENMKLRAEVEALRQDAGRWRKAREILTIESIETAHSEFVNFGLPSDEKENVRADEAIDAAMAAKEGE